MVTGPSDSRPPVAVIVLNWNRCADTLACVESLSKLRYPSARLWVVDNGSTDDSVARLRAGFPSVRIIENGRNLGFAGGNNAGIRLALAEGLAYVWLLNNDTLVDPDALSELMATMRADERLAAVQSMLYYMDQPQRVQACGGRVDLWTGMHAHFRTPREDGRYDYLVAASLLLRSEAIQQVGSLDDGYFLTWEDTDLGLRLRKAGWGLTVARRARVWHRVTASLPRGTALLDEHYFFSTVRFLRRHAPLPILPIALRLTAAVLLRLALLRWDRASAVLRGARGALQRGRA